MWATLWLSVSILVGSCYAMPTGPPLSACQDMIPAGHVDGNGILAPAQTTPSPYQITISPNIYLPGNPNQNQDGTDVQVTVTSNTGARFRGFFVQARRPNTDFGSDQEQLGYFKNLVGGGHQTLDCGTGTATAWAHSNNGQKTSVSATWTAPQTNVGPIIFRATIVEGPNTLYWMDVVSEIVIPQPIVNCPSALYGSSTGTMVFPAPVYAGFISNNQITFTYQQENGVQTPVVGTSPYHTLPNLSPITPVNRPQTITATISDGVNSRSCSIQVYVVAPGAPSITCPADRVEYTTSSEVPLLLTGSMAFSNGARLSVTYLASNPSALMQLPSGLNQDDFLALTLPVDSTSDILAFTTANGYTVACTYRLTVAPYTMNVNCPVDVTSQSLAAQWPISVTRSPANTDQNRFILSYRNNNNIQISPTPLNGLETYVFPMGTTTPVTVTVTDNVGTYPSDTCTFNVFTPLFIDPVVACPTLRYSSQTGTVVVPAPAYAGFNTNNPVTFTYQTTSGQTLTPVDGTLPYHTLQNVNFGQQDLFVQVTDGTNTRSCTTRVTAFAGVQSPDIRCPSNQMINSVGQSSVQGVTFGNTQSAVPVTYISSPLVSITPLSPHTGSTITGNFAAGTTYILAYATDSTNTISAACVFSVTTQLQLSCPNDITLPTSTLSAQWNNIIPSGPTNANGIIVRYNINNSPIQIVPTLVPPTFQQLSYVFPQGTTTVVTVTASDINGLYADNSCQFNVITPVIQFPSVACPSLRYSSQTGTVFVPAPEYAGFNSPVTITYTTPFNQPVTLVDATLPIHTLQNLNFGQQDLSVQVSDGQSTRSCTTRVSAFAGAQSPDIQCPNNRMVTSVGQLSLQGATFGNTQAAVPVTYLSWPLINITPYSPHTESTITGDFAAGITYILAYATDSTNTISAACIFSVTVTSQLSLNCPADITLSTSTLSAQWDNIIPSGPTNADGIIVAYTINNPPIQVIPTLIPPTFQQRTYVFPQGATTLVTVTASDLNGIFSEVSCDFNVITPVIQSPSVACPTLTYSSQTGTVIVPAPVYAGFNGAVTITYTTPTGQTVTLVDSTLPFHTLQNVNSGEQDLFVQVADGQNTRFCTTRVFAFAGPTIICPGNQMRATTSTAAPGTLTELIVPGATALSALTGLSVPVTYISSPLVSLTPFSPHTAPEITGFFGTGTTYVLAYATDNAYSVACFFTVTVTPVSLTCPTNVFTQSGTVLWNNPTPVSFPTPNAVSISYTINNQPISTVQLTNGQQQQYTGLTQGITTTVVARATDPINGLSATCTITVASGLVMCPNNLNAVSGVAQWNTPATPGFLFPIDNIVYTINGGVIQTTQPSNEQQQYNSFPSGTTMVTVRATDTNGNSATCTFSVTEALTVNCPLDRREQTTSTSTFLMFPGATVVDGQGNVVPQTVFYSTNPVVMINDNGGIIAGDFPLGTTTLDVFAVNVNDPCQFTVTVVSILCVPTLTSAVPTVAWFPPSTSGFPNTGAVNINYFLAATNTPLTTSALQNGQIQADFSIGPNLVTAVATDNLGNRAECTFLVMVDTATPPTVTCPASTFVPLSSQTATSQLVAFAFAPFASDSNSNPLNVQLIPNRNVDNLNLNQGTFSIGTTAIEVRTVPDSNGLVGSCTFDVTVLGLRCPVPINSPTTNVNWIEPDRLGFTSTLPITYVNLGNNMAINPTVINPVTNTVQASFPVGSSIVRATTTDNMGNQVSCVFQVEVAEPLAPTISCPDDQVLSTTSLQPVFVSFSPATARDSNNNPLSIQSYTPDQVVSNLNTNPNVVPHTGLFNVDRTVITATTIPDSNGLTNMCTFSITVLGLNCPSIPSPQPSSTVTWTTPTLFGFPPNAFIRYTFNGQPISPDSLPNGQEQFTFPAGDDATVEVTAFDGLGNDATCQFNFITPSASISCNLGQQSSSTDTITFPSPSVNGFSVPVVVQYSVNGVLVSAETFIAAGIPTTVGGLSLGNNVVRATAYDSDGNTDLCEFNVFVAAPQWGPWGQWSPCTLTGTTCYQNRQRVCNDQFPNDSINCAGVNFEDRECPFGSCGQAAWDPWSQWSTCSETCGTGTRTRDRQCIDPIPGDIDYCIGDNTDSENCFVQQCAEWSLWSPYSQCSVTCNGGVETRTRTCINEIGQVLPSADCGFGSSVETLLCNAQACPPDPTWSLWSAWGDCSERCGSGMRLRTRLCNDVNPLDQIYCVGQTDTSAQQTDTEPCNTHNCPIPQWYPWGPWNACSGTCDGGFRFRNRVCDDPFDDDTDTCQGSTSETEICNNFACPVANWEAWGSWTTCSATCGPTAVSTRYRVCDDPNPLDLDECQGSSSSSKSCYDQACPIPVWRLWGAWGQCTATCGGGTRQRQRTCEDFDNDPNTYCIGSSIDTVTCNTLQCLEALWTNWGGWSLCSEGCGSGIRSRQRTCANPTTTQSCLGNPTDTQSCYVQACTVPIWLQWNPWASCSVTCGTGTRQRVRICSEADQSECFIPGNVGAIEIDDECNDFACAVPTWSSFGWSVWTPCTATCNGGVQFRYRDCDDPNPFDFATCPGPDQENQNCNEAPCPQSLWASWNPWSTCSTPCGGGVRKRTRVCYDQGGRGPPCPGTDTEIATCNLNTCPATWDAWGLWGPCSQTCGAGIERRQRTCIAPNPLISCIPDGYGIASTQSRQCFLRPCVDWNTWSSWSSCTVTCGSGIRQRIRTCYDPNSFDQITCEGGNTDTDPEPCNQEPCTEWNPWTSYGGCTVECGGGTRQRVRTCYDPNVNDAVYCTGPREDTDPFPCNAQPCDVTGDAALWGTWSPWTGCSRSCGIGLQQRVRTCNDPDTSDDQTCINGDRADSRICDAGACPPEFVAEWNMWEPWRCSVTCGGGERTRFRTCSDPDPDDSDICLGANSETDPFPCNTESCPVPVWNQWGVWEGCSVTCDGGVRNRRRTCDVPATAPPGTFCEGDDIEQDSVPCNPENCPVIVPPQWGQWGLWDICSVTCDGGIRDRVRSCIDQDQSDFNTCIGDGTQRDSVPCNPQSCPAPPTWNSWSVWGVCSRRCGGGEQIRTRTCNDPEPSDGITCSPGGLTDYQSCNTAVCAAWGTWNSWNDCPVSCGLGQRRRERFCNSLEREFDDTCEGTSFENLDCNADSCPAPYEPNIGLIAGLVVAGLLLAMILAAICLLLFCRRRRTVIYQEKEPLPPPPRPSPPPSPPPSPRPLPRPSPRPFIRRTVQEVELVEDKPRTKRIVAVSMVRGVEQPLAPRYAPSRVRPALLVGGDSAMRYVGSVGDRVVLDDGYNRRDRRLFNGALNDSYL